jgi:uncharacterized membrane protein (UPF0127 family)
MGSSVKQRRRVIRSFLALLWVLSAAQAAHATCRLDAVNLRGDWGQARFTVEIADTAEERAQGLMYRESMPQSGGMLFLYDYPQPLSFWMKNTLIELDMIYLDSSGTVRKIHHRAQPGDLTPKNGGSDLIAVLEINGGLARRLGIGEGTQMQHPAFEKNLAAWPC